MNSLFYACIFCLVLTLPMMSFQTLEADVIKESCPTSSFSINNNGCTGPCGITFVNESIDAVSYYWDFGDGNSSNDPNPTHVYNNPGTYEVTLRAIGLTCTQEFIGTVDIIES